MRSKLAAVAGAVAVLAATTAPAIAKRTGAGLESPRTGDRADRDPFSRARSSAGSPRSPTTPRRGVYYALSDDPSQFQAARFYTVGLDIGDGRLADGDVDFEGVTTLLAPDGSPYAPLSLDPEGLALTKDRELIFTSEGIANSLVDPFVRRYALDGSFLGSLPVPEAFLPNPERTRGVRQNLGFESAGVAPNGRFAFIGDRERARPGRPAGDRVERQPRPDPALPPAERPPRPPVGLRDRPGRRAAAARDAVLGQRDRGAAAAEQPAPDRDGALVLRRSARDGQHDQALRRGCPAPPTSTASP